MITRIVKLIVFFYVFFTIHVSKLNLHNKISKGEMVVWARKL